MIHLPAMRAITIVKPGGPDVLQLVERPTPEPSKGEVRVRIRATAVNRADLLQRMGAYPAPADSPIPRPPPAASPRSLQIRATSSRST